jgi:hypothetical protein
MRSRSRAIDALLLFKIGPANGREAPEMVLFIDTRARRATALAEERNPAPRLTRPNLLPVVHVFEKGPDRALPRLHEPLRSTR